MKTVKEIAAQYNYFTIDSIPKNILSDPYFAENFKYKEDMYAKVQIPEGLKNIKGIQVEVFAKVREQFVNFTDPQKHELYYIDNFYVCIYSEKSNCLLQLMNSNGKYYLYPVYEIVNKLQHNTTYQQRKPFTDELHEPNKIGVFTDNKVAAWITYCNDYVVAITAAKNFVNDGKLVNETKISDTILSLPDAKVQKFNEYIIIETKLFRIEFRLLDNGTYLSQKIQYKGGLNDIINLQL